MPVQKPGRSKQNYRTPPELLDALVKVTGRPYDLDLAADETNCVASAYFDEKFSSLTQNWSDVDIFPEGTKANTIWLNPPFGNIKPFVKKAAETPWREGQMLHVLVPASVGSKWFFDYVWTKAAITFLIGRIKFVGAKGPFPKDCMILTYGHPKCVYPGVFVWNWRPKTRLRPPAPPRTGS